MTPIRTLSIVIAGALAGPTPPQVEVLSARGGLPAHIAGQFNDALGFQRVADGSYLVFDRRDHTVYGVDPARTRAERLVQIGQEPGHLLEPGAFDAEPGGTFVVADGPNGRERIQIFGPSGARIGGFTLPGKNTARVSIGPLILNGVGSLQYTGRSILINQPETGALITEYGLAGSATRTIGTLRATGHEQDRDVHLALNTGLPLADPTGGFYFVFQTGVPLFRKYDARGNLVFERHIEGRELDPVIQALPSVWPRRRTGSGSELPFVPPHVRAAAVDPDGHLWIALTAPFTYEYDPEGEKLRTVQFRGAGLVAPTSLSFADRRRLLVTPGCYEFAVR